MPASRKGKSCAPARPRAMLEAMNKPDPKQPSATPKKANQERLEKALRANLLRRKKIAAKKGKATRGQ